MIHDTATLVIMTPVLFPVMLVTEIAQARATWRDRPSCIHQLLDEPRIVAIDGEDVS